MNKIHKFFCRVSLLCSLLALAVGGISNAAVFPATISASDNARIEVSDPAGGLSWNQQANGLTVMAWVKISIPTGTELTSGTEMTILGNRKTQDWNQPHAWRFYFNIGTGNIEFSARGTSSLTPIIMVERPYLDRWYHVAVVRNNNTYTPYLDGRSLATHTQEIGNTATADGVSIGGFKGGEKFWGEIQEVAIFQSALEKLDVIDYRLRDIPPATGGLKGYFKLGYSSVTSENLKNFAATAPTGTQTATKAGTGTIDFPETDKQGEQSVFDSQKNLGRDALSNLGGAFTWQRTIFSRPTAGIPFEFRIGYNSGINYNSQAVEGGASMFERDPDMGPGWRHSFQIRIVPGTLFAQDAGQGLVGLLMWDGSLETWILDETGENYKTLHGEYRGELIARNSTFEWISPERVIYSFHHPYNALTRLQGRLKEIRDFNGNKVSCDYNTDGKLIKVTDTSRDLVNGVWIFTPDPVTKKLVSVSLQGWTASFTYNTDAVPKLSTFSHTGPAAYTASPALPTTWTMSYNGPNGLLSNVLNPVGAWDVSVSYDKYGRKTAETDGGNRSTTYQYLTPGPRQITRTDGDQFKWIDTFDRKGHVIAKADPLGNVTRFEYYSLTNGLAETNLIGGTPSSPGALKRQTEPLGWVTTFDTYDDRANLLQKTDPLGYVWKWTFAKTSDPAGANGKLTDGSATPVSSLLNRPLTDTRPRTVGETTDWQNRYSYDSHGNLLQHADDLGSLATYTYNSRGQVVTAKDGNYTASNLSIASTAYDPVTGYRISSTDPYQKTTTYQTTELGWVKSATNAIGETSASEFDINGRVIRSTNAAGHAVSSVIDAIGRQRSAIDAKGQKSEGQYDNSNLRTWAKDRAGNISTFAFNGRSLPTHTYSPIVPISQTTGAPVLQSLTTQRTYDNAGRPLREIDPAGDFIEHTYDADGNETITRDKLGRLSRKQYDALNRVAVEIDPLGNTRSTTFDQAGRILTITNPNGSITRHEYDGRGRLKKWTDPEANVWTYTYDGVGNIKDIKDALNGHYLMTYDLRNARLTEENQDHLHWTYTYDDLGRLKTQTEPTGISRTLNYDPAGRLFFVQFSTGRNNFLSYDNNGNIYVAIRIDAGTQLSTFTTFDYDSLDRPISSTDIFGKKVEYGYDALSRVTGLTYPGGKVLSQEFDILGRLVRQTTPASWGSHTLTYSWDKQGRLTGQTYPNGITRAASYDDSGRQTALSYTDPSTTATQIALSYGYDRNGNQTSAKEKGLPSYIPPVAHDETSAYTAAGRVQSRTDAADPSGSKNWTYEFKNADNTPSFNLSKATNPTIGSLALTYDEDNRTTQLVVTPPTGSPSTVADRYDATGRRISRTLTTPTSPASETRYVLNLIGGMERILADTNAAGTISSYYLHGPDLAVKISAADSTQITCYHADASGNIVRLTDKTRAITAQYAYSDYGRPFAVTGASGTDTNPYRFVGSQGVMEEPILPGLYFMRARYYLADAGVFLSVDPVKNIGAGWKPEAYGYGAGNPIAYNDPDGEMPQMVLGALVGGAVGGGVEILNQTASWASGEKFDREQILHSTASGIISGAVGSVNPIAGGSSGQIYDDYIEAVSKGESYDLSEAVVSAAFGGIKSLATDAIFNGLVPKVGNNGGNYFGKVRGLEPITISGGFSGSHFRNDMVKETFGAAQKITSTVLSNLKKSTITAVGTAQNLNKVNATKVTNSSNSLSLSSYKPSTKTAVTTASVVSKSSSGGSSGGKSKPGAATPAKSGSKGGKR